MKRTRTGTTKLTRTGLSTNLPVSLAGTELPARGLEKDTRRVASLLVRSLGPATADWSPRDLADMLLQELRYKPAAGEALAHFRETREHAKRAIGGGDEAVHPELALGLYYVSLSRASLEEGAWISKLTPAEVVKGLRHVQKFSWVKSRPELVAMLTALEAIKNK